MSEGDYASSSLPFSSFPNLHSSQFVPAYVHKVNSDFQLKPDSSSHHLHHTHHTHHTYHTYHTYHTHQTVEYPLVHHPLQIEKRRESNENFEELGKEGERENEIKSNEERKGDLEEGSEFCDTSSSSVISLSNSLSSSLHPPHFNHNNDSPFSTCKYLPFLFFLLFPFSFFLTLTSFFSNSLKNS